MGGGGGTTSGGARVRSSGSALERGGRNRSQIVEHIANTTGLTNRQAREAVDAFVSTIGVQIRSGSRVTIYGFGSFNPTARKARTGRNPRTGAPIKIASARGIRFSPATALKAELNTRKVAGRKAASAKATKTTATPPARSGARTTAVAAKAPTRQVSPPLKKATAAAPTTKKASSTKVMAKKVGTSTKVTKA